MADCPECEYCCAIGLCCPPSGQQIALVNLFVAAGSTDEEAQRHAAIIVAARTNAQKKA